VSGGVTARCPAANANPSHRGWLARRDIRNHFNFMILFLLFYTGFPMKNDRIIKLDILKQTLIYSSLPDFQLYDPVVFHWKTNIKQKKQDHKVEMVSDAFWPPAAAGWPVPLGTPAAPNLGPTTAPHERNAISSRTVSPKLQQKVCSVQCHAFFLRKTIEATKGKQATPQQSGRINRRSLECSRGHPPMPSSWASSWRSRT
jgi:hypothetical protein